MSDPLPVPEPETTLNVGDIFIGVTFFPAKKIGWVSLWEEEHSCEIEVPFESLNDFINKLQEANTILTTKISN